MDQRPKYRKLTLPPIEPRWRRVGAVVQIWDALRGQWLVLTPEEWVRRHLIDFLIRHCGAQPLRIVQEYPVPLNGQAQRADVVVVDDEACPLLLAECKAPDIEINQQTSAQAMRYNGVLRARYVVLTNGLKHYCYEATEEGYRPLSEFPNLGLADSI